MGNEFVYNFSESSFDGIVCQRTGVETNKSANHFLSHFLESCALVFVDAGRLTIKAGECAEDMAEGDVCILYRNSPLSFTPHGNFRYGFIAFDGYGMLKLLQSRCGLKKLSQTAQKIANYRDFFSLDDYGGRVYELTALSLIFDALSLCADKGGGTGQNPETIVESFIDYVESNYNCADLKVSKICEYLGVSVTYFTALFGRTIGMSPRQYIISVRMQKAMNMLKNSGLSVKEIAGYVGYTDALHFSSAFKKNINMSPSQYRKVRS